jgi:hypothetical protein
MTYEFINIVMVSNYKRKKFLEMNTNTDCYPSGLPLSIILPSGAGCPPSDMDVNQMTTGPPALSRSMSVAPSSFGMEVQEEEPVYTGPPALSRSMSVAPSSFGMELQEEEPVYTGPPGLSRSMSVAPSGDTDMQLDMGEDDDEEYDNMKCLYRMKQAGNAALLEVEEIRMFKNYIAQQKRLLLDQYAVVSDKLDELGEIDWLTQHSYKLSSDYTRRMRLAEAEVAQTPLNICPPGLTRSMTISIPSTMDVDQPGGPIALTRSVNIANDIFEFTQSVSPTVLNPNPTMDVDVGVEENETE